VNDGSPNVFSKDIYQPSIKIDDALEPEEASAQPEVSSAAEGVALRVEVERNRSYRSRTGRPHIWNISSEESCPSTRSKLGDWLGAPSRSFYWVMKRSCTTTAPQVFSNDAYPLPKDKSCYKKYTRGLWSPCSTSSPRGKRFPIRFLLANRSGRRH
jgi:hypothetical protein